MKKQFTVKNVLIALLILVIIWLAMCNKPVPQPPDVIPVETQRETVRIDSIASAKYKDSVQKIVNDLQKEADHWEGNWKEEVKENAALQDTLGSWLGSSVPDTCESYKQRAILEYNKLVLSNKKKDTACSKTITSYKGIVTQKDVLIKKGKEDWTKLKVNFDTALAQQTKLEKYIKQIKPKREIIAGIGMMTSYNNFKPQVGVMLGYRTKQGIGLNVTVYTNQQISVTLHKPIFRF